MKIKLSFGCKAVISSLNIESKNFFYKSCSVWYASWEYHKKSESNCNCNCNCLFPSIIKLVQLLFQLNRVLYYTRDKVPPSKGVNIRKMSKGRNKKFVTRFSCFLLKCQNQFYPYLWGGTDSVGRGGFWNPTLKNKWWSCLVIN